MLSFRKFQFLAAFLLAAWFLALPNSSMAQSNVGEVNGTVYDQAGAVVPGAEITLKDLDQGGVRKAISSASGAYVIPSVQPSRYSLTVINAGFKSYLVPEFKLDVNQARTFDAHLEVGAVTESVEVKAQTVAIDRTDATIGAVIHNTEIVEMPLNGRNFSQLMQLSAGVNSIGNTSVFLITGGSSPSVNGMRYQMNNFTLDGVDNNMRFTNSFASSPPPDAIAEFKVSSHESSSASNLAAGATVNVVTRSGSKALHGAAWDFLRNDKLAANGFFNNLDGIQNTAYKQNQFGFFVGGPIVIPHLLDGRKSRTYFSAYYEGVRFVRSGGTQAVVPTAAQRTGDFSSELGAALGTDCLGRTVYKGQIYDPFTTVANSSCPGGYVRDPYPNNVVPPSQIQDFAKSYMQYLYPSPNFTPTLATGPANLVLAQGSRNSSNQYGVRGDQIVSDKLSVFGRMSQYRYQAFSPGGLPTNAFEQVNAGVNGVFHTTYVMNPTLLADFAFGYNRASIPYRSTPIGQAYHDAPGVGDNLATLFPNGYYPPAVGFPGTTITGTSYTYYALADPDSSWEVRADSKKVSGSHSFEFGGHWMHVRHFTGLQGLTNLGFDPTVNDAPGFQGSGNSFAAFLVGVPWSSAKQYYPTVQADTNVFTGYLGDTWKVTPKLTFDYGVQYVLATRPVVAGDQISLFDFDIAKTQPDATDFAFAYIWAGKNPITGAASNAQSRAIRDGDHNNWAPRIGLAYAPNDKTVIRAGFGIFYDYNTNIVQNSVRGGVITYPYSRNQTVSGINTQGPGAINYQNPFPPLAGGTATAASTLALHSRDPYAIEYNLGIERLLPGAFKLSVGYVGAGGRKLVWNTTENIAPLGSNVPGSIAARRPLHNAGSFFVSDDVGLSNYHALQVELERRFTGGLTFRNSYTWSKSLDLISDANWIGHYTYNRHVGDYGPSTWDMRHVNTTSFVYDLPFGRGRKFASGTSKVADAVIGGWRVSSIVSIHSGLPYFVISGTDNENTGHLLGFLVEPANQISNPTPSGFQQTRLHWIDPSAFAVPSLGTMGNISKDKYVGPTFQNFDMALEKDFKIRERAKLQFRSEFFNAFNHTNFGNPGNNVSSPSTLGLISSAYGAREIQFALKLVW